MLSILFYGKLFGFVKGMDIVNKELVVKYGKDNYYLMVNLFFYGFCIMVVMGIVIMGVFVLGFFLICKKKLIFYKYKWMFWIVVLIIFVLFLVNIFGWIVIE